MVKSWTSIILFISFAGIAVLGALAMNHVGNAYHGCLAATAGVTSCANENNPFASAIFHLDVFKSFSTAAVVSSITLLLAAALLFAFWLIFDVNLPVAAGQSFSLLLKPEPDNPPFKKHFIQWLAFHENSPTTK